MKKLFFLPVFLLSLASGAGALTMDEAVGAALKGNHRVREQGSLVDAQRMRIESERASFLPGMDLEYSYTLRDEENEYKSRESSVFTARMSYNLFNGFSDLKRLKAAALRLDASVFEKKAVEADIVFSVKRAYIEVLRAERNLDAEKEAVGLLERQARDAGLFLREGLIARNDLLRVQVELASVKQRLLGAESSLVVRRGALQRLLGAELGDEQRLKDVPPSEYSFDLEALRRKMLERRSELGYLKALRGALGHSRDAMMGGYLPSVDLSLTHDIYGDSVFPDGDHAPYGNDTKAMLSAKWNVFDGLRRKSEAGALGAEIKAVEERLKDTEAYLSLALKASFEAYRVAAGSLEVAEKAVEEARENYRITENQFRQRMATTADLLDARVFLTRAQTDFNEALYDIHAHAAEIERAVEEGP